VLAHLRIENGLEGDEHVGRAGAIAAGGGRPTAGGDLLEATRRSVTRSPRPVGGASCQPRDVDGVALAAAVDNGQPHHLHRRVAGDCEGTEVDIGEPAQRLGECGARRANDERSLPPDHHYRNNRIRDAADEVLRRPKVRFCKLELTAGNVSDPVRRENGAPDIRWEKGDARERASVSNRAKKNKVHPSP